MKKKIVNFLERNDVFLVVLVITFAALFAVIANMFLLNNIGEALQGYFWAIAFGGLTLMAIMAVVSNRKK